MSGQQPYSLVDDDDDLQDIPLADAEEREDVAALSPRPGQALTRAWLPSATNRWRLCVGATAAVVVIMLGLLLLFEFTGAGDNGGDDGGSGRLWLVSSARRSILPPVNGSTDYIHYDTFAIDDETAGVFVADFDHGPIPVGNGAAEAHWVRSPMYVRCVALTRPGSGDSEPISVVVVAELYMLFKQDLDAFHERLQERLVGEQGRQLYSRLRFVFHAQHTHEGPDTAGLDRPVNHRYFSYLVDQMVGAVLDALLLRPLRPALLHWGIAPFYFGVGDVRDPLFQDNNVRVLRATAADSDDEVLFTLVQWNYHPENALDYAPRIGPDDCRHFDNTSSTWQCTSRGSFLFSDFPAAFAQRTIELQRGSGEALYINGALGGQIGPHAAVWSPTPDSPIGNGLQRPPDAAPVPTPSIQRANLVGRALADFVHSAVSVQRPVSNGSYEFVSADFWVPVNNFPFLVASAPSDADPAVPVQLGNRLRDMWHCSQPAQPSDDTCTLVTAAVEDPATGLRYMPATHVKSVVSYLRLGSVQFITAPLELAPELAVGLPSDFDALDDEALAERYYRNDHYHAVGRQLQLPGVLLQTLPDIDSDDDDSDASLQIVVGLSGDELGYAVSLSDVRYLCPADRTTCMLARNVGVMNYSNPDLTGDFDVSLAGEQCVKLFNDRQATLAQYRADYGDDMAQLVLNTCFYIGLPNPSGLYAYDHYEESLSPFADIARIYLQAVATMLGTQPRGRLCRGHYCSAVSRHD